jgi:uncharacterized protein
MKCFHHNDPDGRLSAAIVAKFCPNMRPADFIEMDYAKPFPLEVVGCHETVYIVDFSIRESDMRALLILTSNVVWIDHHASCKDYWYASGSQVPGLRDFTEHGPSGCELTWKHLYGDQNPPEIVDLIGDYDSWRLEMPESKAVHLAVQMEDQSPTGKFWRNLLRVDYQLNSLLVRLIEDGETIAKYRDQYCADFRMAFGYATMIDGYPAYACNMYRFGSQGFGDLMDIYPVVIAYAHDGKEFTVSVYSTKGVDCAAVCKKYGGGGHRGAAGFHAEKLPFWPS